MTVFPVPKTITSTHKCPLPVLCQNNIRNQLVIYIFWSEDKTDGK